MAQLLKLFVSAASMSLVAVACSSGSASAPSDESRQRSYVLSSESISEGLARNGGFPAHLQQPSEVLQDFFGVLAARPAVPLDQFQSLMSDLRFVPTDNPWEFREPSGEYSVEYYDEALLTVELPDRVASATDSFFVVRPGGDGGDASQSADRFVRALIQSGFGAELLRTNANFSKELLAQAELDEATLPPAECLPETEGFFTSSADPKILLFGDAPHGSFTTTDGVMGVMQANPNSFDWFGIEMIPTSFQDDLDSLANTTGPVEESPSYEKLANYFNTTFAWERHPKPWSNGENPYWTAVKTALQLGKTVHALDVEAADQFYRGAGEIPISFFARNLVWSAALPQQGSGIVFGGPAHFDFSKVGFDRGFNVQDIYKETLPNVEVYCAFLRAQ